MFRNNNNNNLQSQFRQFADNLKRSGKDPQELLNELMASGKYSQADLNRAKTMASQFAKLLR